MLVKFDVSTNKIDFWFQTGSNFCLNFCFLLAPAKAPEFRNWSISKTSRDKRDVTVVWKVQSWYNIFITDLQPANIHVKPSSVWGLWW